MRRLTLAMAASLALAGGAGAFADQHVDNGGATQGNSPSDPDGMENGGPDKPGGSGGVDKSDQDGNNGCGNDVDREDDNNGNCGGGNDKVKAGSQAKHDGCATSAAARANAGNASNANASAKAKAKANANTNANANAKGCAHGADVAGTATRLGGAANGKGRAAEVLGNGLLRMGRAGTVRLQGPAALGTKRAAAAGDRAEVLGVTLNRGTATALQGGVAGVAGAATGTLPTTGGAVATMFLFGLGSIAAGTVLTRRQAGHS